MIKIAIFSVLLVLLVQDSRCEQQQQIQFQDFFNNAKKYFDGWTKEVREKVGLSENPSGEEIVRVFREHNEKLAQNLKETGQKLEQELKSNPNLQSVVDQIKAKLNEEAENLKKHSPDLAANMENLGKTLQNTWGSVTQEIEKGIQDFNKAGGKRDEIEKNFEGLIDKIKSGAQDLEAKLIEMQKKNRR